MRQLIKNQVTDRVVRLGDYIPLRMARAPITSVNYNYVNASRVPASGEITTSGVQLRFNNVDSDGVNHGAYLAQVAIGDTVTINGQSASITTDPIWTSSGYWYFDVDAWPFMENGNYEVSITQEQPSVFSPADLFASGEQGAWYDPSDLTTMFQDIAGTTPVTADGQTVGLILDKSKGLVLGSELNANPGPFTTTTGYVGNGSTLTVSGGNITSTYVADSADLILDVVGLTIGKTYSANIVVVTSTGSAVYASSYDPNPWSNEITGSKQIPVGESGTINIKRTAATTGIRFRVRSVSANASFTVSSFSVRELSGNHAVAPSDAARPLYKVTGLAKWNDFDAVDDVLNTTFPSSLGSSCTVAKAVVGGSPTILTGQTIGTSWAESTDNAGLIIIDRALTTQETTDLTAWLIDKGATA